MPKVTFNFAFYVLTVSFCALTACGGGGGGGNSDSDLPDSNETPGDSSSARADQSAIPDNGTQPSESTCSAGTYTRVANSDSDACDSEQFDIYVQNGYYAVSGFVDNDYYFFEAGREGQDGSGKDNLMDLIGVPYGGTNNTACLFACKGSTVTVSCVGPGAQLCDFTDYARTS